MEAHMHRLFTLILLSGLLLGCNSLNVPVREGSTNAIVPPMASASTAGVNQSYIVQPGDTLYSIAWEYNMDYRDLAAINNIPPPYLLEAGQTLALTGSAPVPVMTEPTGVQIYAVGTPEFVETPATVATAEPMVTTEPAQESTSATPVAATTESSTEKPVTVTTATAPPATTSVPVATTKVATAVPVEPTAKVGKWVWPAKGAVSRGFSNKNKGIDIQGNRGDPIYATAGGKVVYSGTGLRGYGQLIIIKHNAEFLSAYAHNSMVLVAEGDDVKQGQKIAEMGDTGTNKVKLHFELRLRGKPVDPQKYLPRR